MVPFKQVLLKKRKRSNHKYFVYKVHKTLMNWSKCIKEKNLLSGFYSLKY